MAALASRRKGCAQWFRPARTLAIGVLGASSLLGTSGLSPVAAHTANLGTERSVVARLSARITAEGELLQQLVLRYNEAKARVAQIDTQLVASDHMLAVERKAELAASHELQADAIEAYVNAASVNAAPPVLPGQNSDWYLAPVYAEIAGNRLDKAVTLYQLAHYRTSVTHATLAREETQAQSDVRSIIAAQLAANAALVSDDSLLLNVRGHLATLLSQQAAARARAEEKQEEAMLAQREAAFATPAGIPMPTLLLVGGGGDYANPLRSIGGLVAERIDQGVDYRGFGPIYAIGDGVVLSTYNLGWPGGTYITYRLTGGSEAGLIVYAAEDIDPSVQVGESVTSNTVIGHLYEGPDGIETGWAAGSTGDTMAMVASQFSGANSTAYGVNFSAFLQSLGAPGGVLQGPPTGTVPFDWPQF